MKELGSGKKVLMWVFFSHFAPPPAWSHGLSTLLWLQCAPAIHLLVVLHQTGIQVMCPRTIPSLKGLAQWGELGDPPAKQTPHPHQNTDFGHTSIKRYCLVYSCKRYPSKRA